MRCKTNLSHGHILVFVLLLTFPFSGLAKCGSVDYSQGAEALARMHDYVVTMMLYEIFGKTILIYHTYKSNLKCS